MASAIGTKNKLALIGLDPYVDVYGPLLARLLAQCSLIRSLASTLEWTAPLPLIAEWSQDHGDRNDRGALCK